MQSHSRAKKGDFRGSKVYGNASAIMSVVTIIIGLIGLFIGLIFCAWIVADFVECGLTGYCYS